MFQGVDFSLVLQGLEVLAVIFGFTMTVRTIEQARDSRNVDFVIDAEGQVDPLFLALLNAPPEVIRKTVPGVVTPDIPDDKIAPYMHIYFAYRHLSRIIYMLQNESVSIGMSKAERRQFIDDWINEIKKYDQEIVRDLHSRCRLTGEFNNGFTKRMDKLLGFTA
jgi:hypothetical protein